MEQFNLDKWLQDKSRKVITRDGRVVKILDTEFESGNGNKSVLAKCIYNNKAAVYVYTTDGKANNIGETENDLFFADEKEELTEFEKELRYWIGQSLCNYENNGCVSNNMSDSVNIYLEVASKKLLDLARKEILKDLPKWKDVSGKNGAGTKDYEIVGYYLVKGNYAIYLEDLDKLPKEE